MHVDVTGSLLQAAWLLLICRANYLGLERELTIKIWAKGDSDCFVSSGVMEKIGRPARQC